jgi:hypothetical protein
MESSEIEELKYYIQASLSKEFQTTKSEKYLLDFIDG